MFVVFVLELVSLWLVLEEKTEWAGFRVKVGGVWCYYRGVWREGWSVRRERAVERV